MDKKMPVRFDAEVYGELTPTANPQFSRARLRAFYQGDNRNGSFISEENTKGAIENLSGLPVIGTYDMKSKDFLGHEGPENAKGYGFVSFPANFAWEAHKDKDGVMRDYACFDVDLWTGYFTEAKEIIGKPHSMELDETTTFGKWKANDEGNLTFHYDTFVIKGFCVLGSQVEPCFEGSEFFTKHSDLSDKLSSVAFKEVLKYAFNLQTELNKYKEKEEGGKHGMDFNLKFPEFTGLAYEAWTKLNPEVDGTRALSACITTTGDKWVDAYQYNDNTFTRYSTTDCAINWDSPATMFLASHTDEDYSALETRIAELEGKVTDYEATVGELNTTIENLNGKLTEYSEQAKAAEDAQKGEMLESFSDKLPEDQINELKESLDSFTLETLERELVFRHYRSATEFSSKANNKRVHVGGDDNADDLVDYLQNYVK